MCMGRGAGLDITVTITNMTSYLYIAAVLVDIYCMCVERILIELKHSSIATL